MNTSSPDPADKTKYDRMFDGGEDRWVEFTSHEEYVQWREDDKRAENTLVINVYVRDYAKPPAAD